MQLRPFCHFCVKLCLSDHDSSHSHSCRVHQNAQKLLPALYYTGSKTFDIISEVTLMNSANTTTWCTSWFARHWVMKMQQVSESFRRRPAAFAGWLHVILLSKWEAKAFIKFSRETFWTWSFSSRGLWDSTYNILKCYSSWGLQWVSQSICSSAFWKWWVIEWVMWWKQWQKKKKKLKKKTEDLSTRFHSCLFKHFCFSLLIICL